MVDIISDAEFNEVVMNSDIPVVVDFFAPWCAPCKMLLPILEDLADVYEDEVLVVKINADDSDLPAKYGVRGIPTLLFMSNGEVQDTHVGTGSGLKDTIESKIQALL